MPALLRPCRLKHDWSTTGVRPSKAPSCSDNISLSKGCQAPHSEVRSKCAELMHFARRLSMVWWVLILLETVSTVSQRQWREVLACTFAFPRTLAQGLCNGCSPYVLMGGLWRCRAGRGRSRIYLSGPGLRLRIVSCGIIMFAGLIWRDHNIVAGGECGTRVHTHDAIVSSDPRRSCFSELRPMQLKWVHRSGP